LHAHLEQQGVEFLQFAFRWMNCLLMREVSLNNTIRMWDTYMVRHTATHSKRERERLGHGSSVGTRVRV
jgi:TBC1 domain family member 2